jgi:hypothetical protein
MAYAIKLKNVNSHVRASKFIFLHAGTQKLFVFPEKNYVRM